MKKVEVTVKYMNNGNVLTHTFEDVINSSGSLYAEGVLELAGFTPRPTENPLVDSIEITLADNKDRGAIIKCDKRFGITTITIYPMYWEGVQEYATVLSYSNNNSLKHKMRDIEDAVYTAIYKPSDRQISLYKACLDTLGDDCL